MRPGSRTGQGMSGNDGSVRPVSNRMMIGTARIRTGQVSASPGVQAAVGAAINTEVVVADRPITQQGMKSMKTATQGLSRQVQDSSYFVSLLRQKMTNIRSELTRLTSEKDRLETDSSQQSQLEQKYENLLKDVRNFEGTLADINLARDKLRTSTDPHEVRNYVTQLQQRNDADAKELDEYYILKQRRETEVTNSEQEISTIRQKVEINLSHSNPTLLNQLKEVEGRLLQLEALQESAREKQLADRMAAKEFEDRAMDDVDRAEFEPEEEKLASNQRELVELTEQLNEMKSKGQSSSVLSKFLQSKIKAQKARMREVDGACETLNKEIAGLRAQLTSNQEGSSAGDSQQKLSTLMKKDKELTVFIDEFEQNRLKIASEIERFERRNVLLMQYGSKEIISKMDNSQEGEVSFKQRQMETSQMTKSRLLEEMNRKAKELEDLNKLNSAVMAETTELSASIEAMRNETAQLEDVDGLRRSANSTISQLAAHRKKYIKRRDAARSQSNQLQAKHDQLCREIANNETGRELEEQVKKMRYYEQNIHQLREFIEVRGRETDYKSVASDCMDLVNMLNEGAKRMAIESEKVMKAR